MTEIDAADVLSSYTSVLLKGKSESIRDLHDLPYPKDVIKDVLVYCIRIANRKNREFLMGAYVSLADFQPLTAAERSALDSALYITALNDLDRLSNDELKAAAAKVAEAKPVVAAISRRMAAESAQLVKELRTAGVGSQPNA